ncbi:MAG: N-acetylglucosamine-6-phosphate deacetylase, partial [Oscillospiraceae bacterium]|nr:N-acetylglucosamine-6-phosphate deacetylase [Oscillospiraceae bacterium]
NGRVYLGRRFEERTLLLRGSRLRVLDADVPIPEGAQVVDVSGKRVVPGFLDSHTHGGGGVDVNGAAAEDLEKLSRFFAGNGTTAWLCSVLTATEEQPRWCIDQFKAHRAGGQLTAELLGIHLEGPFLAAEYKGAMPEHLLRRGDPGLLRAYQERAEGGIRYLTVSPEVPGAAELIPEAKKLGITTAIGHSGADYESSIAAIAAGAEAATHTFNAMGLFHQHRPAIMGAVLESDVYCEMICDGRHLHPASVRLLIKTKGLDRVVAITDSIMAAGLPDGRYHLGVNEVVVEDGDAKLASDGTRAGSTLTQDAALRNLLAFTGRPLEELLPALTENPARLIGVFDRKGSIADGKDSDLVVLDVENRVDMVCTRGRRLER